MSQDTKKVDGVHETLTEGYVRKGGINAAVSQIATRPPDPPPMRPAAQQPKGTQAAPQPGASNDGGKGKAG